MTRVKEALMKTLSIFLGLLTLAILFHAFMFRFEMVGTLSDYSYRLDRLTGSVLSCRRNSCEWAEIQGIEVKKVHAFIDDAGVLDK